VEPLYTTGLPALDVSLSGGVARGEVTILAARPGIGKTLFGMQWAQHLASEGISVAFLSEEMTRLALGKRVVQNATAIDVLNWRDRIDDLYEDIERHWSHRKSIMVPVSKCRTYLHAAEYVEILSQQHSVEVIFVDYLQRLRGAGTGRYEEVTNGSIALASAAVEHNISLVCLAQLNRQTDHDDRPPKFSDLRDSGQIEQDADNVLFLDWPLKRNPLHKPPRQYWIYVAKCRNRGVQKSQIEVRIDPIRQLLQSFVPEPKRENVFDEWNNS
jgi:replicative DNA helicase